MNILKKAMIGATLVTAAAVSAHAAPITVAGVTFESGAFVGSTNFTQWFVNGSGAPTTPGAANTLTGVGEFNQINGVSTDVNVNGPVGFAPNKELTFQFGGFEALANGQFSNGWLKVYIDSAPDYTLPASNTAPNVANATDGQLWLSLEAVSSTFFSRSSVGSNPFLNGSLFVDWAVNLADAGGGLAGAVFNTNTFGLTSSEFDVASDASGTFLGTYATSTGNFSAFTQEVPEPTSIALIGLGLLGVAARRRKLAK